MELKPLIEKIQRHLTPAELLAHFTDPQEVWSSIRTIRGLMTPNEYSNKKILNRMLSRITGSNIFDRNYHISVGMYEIVSDQLNTETGVVFRWNINNRIDPRIRFEKPLEYFPSRADYLNLLEKTSAVLLPLRGPQGMIFPGFTTLDGILNNGIELSTLSDTYPIPPCKGGIGYNLETGRIHFLTSSELHKADFDLKIGAPLSFRMKEGQFTDQQLLQMAIEIAESNGYTYSENPDFGFISQSLDGFSIYSVGTSRKLANYIGQVHSETISTLHLAIFNVLKMAKPGETLLSCEENHYAFPKMGNTRSTLYPMEFVFPV